MKWYKPEDQFDPSDEFDFADTGEDRTPAQPGSKPVDASFDDEQTAKQSAIKSLGKHIGADTDSDSEGGDEDVSPEPDATGAIPTFHLRKKKKSGGGGGGMGGMMGGGGGGGMDISSIMGMMG